jgi:hypothetical protein
LSIDRYCWLLNEVQCRVLVIKSAGVISGMWIIV